ncbi:hypothetical protein [Paenibacillus sp. YYML68]|uniref:hypothetical protein n=1 Tax=Paenibacillus sp. YYML68 TaxID=2909250 RepID=UPI00249127FD|nr:hypothetical protein [Paenibacillus sp. YYML68]
MKIIVITGAPGVGKTETGRQLVNLYQSNSAWIDTDAFASISPFVINDEFYKLAGNNLKSCINNYYQWGIENLIISGVILPGGIYDQITQIRNEEVYTWKFYFLNAEMEIIRNRIVNDYKPQDAEQRLSWLHLNDNSNELPNCRVINNSNKTIKEVAMEIFTYENFQAEKGA